MSKTILAILICLLSTHHCFAQFPSATAEHAVLKKEVGSWDATVKMWVAGPDKDPVTSTASETNKMMGEMWLVSDFTSTIRGQSFSGHGIFGYDPEKKKYTGTWVDSMMPSMAIMAGDDKEKETMTYLMDGKGPDGKPQKTKLVTVFKDKDTRVMMMFAEAEREFVKSMEMIYTRKKK